MPPNSEQLFDSFVITQNKKLTIINKTKCSFIIRYVTYFNNQYDGVYTILRVERGVWQICFCHVNFSDGHLKYELDNMNVISVATETPTSYEIHIDSKQWLRKCTNFNTSNLKIMVNRYTLKYNNTFENVPTCKCLMDKEFKALDMYMKQLTNFKYMYTYNQFFTTLCHEILVDNYCKWLSGKHKIYCYYNADSNEISSCLMRALPTGYYQIRHTLFTRSFVVIIRPNDVQLQ